MEVQSVIAIGRQTIAAEAEALTLLCEGLDAHFAEAIEVMRNVKGRLIISGVGKSGHIAGKIAATLSSTGNPAQFVHPAEAAHGDMGMITAQDVLLLLSKSGNSAEFAPVLEHAVRNSIPIIAMTANADSLLGQHADLVLRLPAIGETPITDTPAPTNSTTMMLAMGDALAVALMNTQGFSREGFAKLHPGGQLGAQLMPVAQVMHKKDELPLLPHSASIHEVVREITQKRFCCVGILDNDRLIGLITDGDLRRHLNGNLMERTARQIATGDPITIAPDMLCVEAITLMETRQITVLFVLEGDKPVGIVHLHDLLRLKVL